VCRKVGAAATLVSYSLQSPVGKGARVRRKDGQLWQALNFAFGPFTVHLGAIGTFSCGLSGRFLGMHRVHLLLALPLLVACAGGPGSGSAARYSEQMDPAWSGVLDSTMNIGVLLVSRPGVYSRAGFEALASTDEVLRPLVPGLRWTPVDSSHPALGSLRGWDLDSLSLQLLADSMVWKLPYANYGEQIVLRKAGLSEATRATLRKVGTALGVQVLIALRPGDVVPAKDVKVPAARKSDADLAKARAAAAAGVVESAVGDSSNAVDDAVWFGVFDMRTGGLWYSRDFRVSGSRSAALSAEGAWARSAWEAFTAALRELPARRSAAVASEPR